MKFTFKEKEILLNLARKSIMNHLKNTKENFEVEKPLPDKLKGKLGAFVSVYLLGDLRGCIGRIETEDELVDTIHDMAISAAFRDRRFDPVSKEELKDLKIEISVLSPLIKIKSIDEIIPGKHGIMIKKDFRSGTFLPQVAARTGWNVTEMLAHCSRDKVGIGSNGWKDSDIYIYEAEIFSDSN